MKRGTVVAVCHDGKWGRRVKGEVIGTRRGHHILVRFPHPETDDPVEFWARRRPAVRRMKTVRRSAGFTMSTFKRYVSFAGWADIDWFCPWYAVYPWSEEE